MEGPQMRSRQVIPPPVSQRLCGPYGSLQEPTGKASQHFSRGLWAIQEARWEGPLGSVGGHR